MMERRFQSYGRASVSEFLGDRIVYRSLKPYDQRLPDMDRMGKQLGIPANKIPRKNELEFARVIAYLLQECHDQDGHKGKIERLVFVGDTRLLDGTAYANLLRVSGWHGMAFIAAEDTRPAGLNLVEGEGGFPIYLSNRWAALKEFDDRCRKQGFPIEEGAAVVIDLDKTTIGARGRNGQVIDRARMQAVEETVAGLISDDFDSQKFAAAYEPLNQPEFHPFTADNQDYLAYICLILGSGLISYEALVGGVRSGEMGSFGKFITEVDQRKGEMTQELQVNPSRNL